MNRRDFLLLNVRSGTRDVVLSCEELYMRLVDARAEGSAHRLLDNLATELGSVDTLHLTSTAWLADPELNLAVEGILREFLARGGRIIRETTSIPA